MVPGVLQDKQPAGWEWWHYKALDLALASLDAHHAPEPMPGLAALQVSRAAPLANKAGCPGLGGTWVLPTRCPCGFAIDGLLPRASERAG